MTGEFQTIFGHVLDEPTMITDSTCRFNILTESKKELSVEICNQKARWCNSNIKVGDEVGVSGTKCNDVRIISPSVRFLATSVDKLPKANHYSI